MQHEHGAPDYYGRCEGCGIRLESPSRWMLDEAKRTGATLVTFTKSVTLTPELRALTGRGWLSSDKLDARFREILVAKLSEEYGHV